MNYILKQTSENLLNLAQQVTVIIGVSMSVYEQLPCQNSTTNCKVISIYLSNRNHGILDI